MLDEMTQTTVDAGGEFLEHYGVKGMKWGFRKSRSDHQRAHFGGAKRTASGLPRKTSSANKEWRKKAVTSENVAKMIKESEPAYRRDLKRINAKFGGKVTKKTERAYHSEVYAATLNNMDDAARKVFGTSPDGKYRMTASINPRGNVISVRPVRVEANMKVEAVLKQMAVGADPGNFSIDIELVKGEDGLFTGEMKFLNIEGGTIEQSAVDAGSEFLAHFGVKGMKWGHRMSQDERNARRRASDEKKSKARLRREDRRDRRQTARLDRKKTEAQIKAQAKAQVKIEKARAKVERKLAETTNSGQNGSNQASKGDSDDIIGKSKRESKKLRKEAAKNARQINDADIEAYTKRLQKERQMKDLITQDTAPKRAATNDFVKSVGKTVLTTAAVAAGSYAVGAALNKGGWPDLAKAASGGKWKPGDAKDSIDKATKTAKDTPIDLGKYKLPPDTFPKRPPAPFPPPPTYKPPKTRLPPPPPPPPPKRLLAPDGKPFRR